MSLYRRKDYYIAVLIIFLIIFIVMFVPLFSEFGFKKPTEKDYKGLYKQAKILEEDFSQIFFMDNAEYELDDSKMTVTLSNKDCANQLKLIFNKELNKIVSEKKYDNYISIKNLILISFETAFIGTMLLALILKLMY